MPEVVVAGVAVSINENGPQAGTELDRLLACFTSPPPAGAALHVNATIVIQLAGETDSVRIVFLGSADEWQPLRQAVHSLTTSKAAGIDAEVVATFSMPVAVDDPLVHDLSDQAANVGPAKATVRLRLEPAK
jgi:hypothetical protein